MKTFLLFSLLFWLLYFPLCSARDTLSFGKNISQDSSENLVSIGEKFQLGFFSLPIESEASTTTLKKYLGIWYQNLEPQTVVWIANRNKPIVDSNGVFQISQDGNLVVADASQSYWSTDLEVSSSRNYTVKLLDSGNLVLMDDDHGYLWQSFQHPTDTFLPGMKMDMNLTLSSWKNESDPESGSFVFKQARRGDYSNFIVNNQLQLYWSFDGDNSDKMIHIIRYLLENATSYSLYGKLLNKTVEGDSYYDKSRLLMNSSGEIQFWKWDESINQWFNMWSRPDVCDINNYCGNFSSCNKNNLFPCKCLPGFRPRLSGNNYVGKRFQGCVRKSSMPCISSTATTNNNMMFINLTKIKEGKPDITVFSETEESCQSQCLNMCPTSPCNAYSYNSSYSDRSSNSICGIWTRELPTLQEEQDDGHDFSILVKTSDIESTVKSCGPCGTYIIPYPLSTGPTCGDPMYNKFNCNSLTGQVSFMMQDGKSYRVTLIKEVDRKFYIQTNDSDSDRCDESSSDSYQDDKPSSPFSVTSWCYREDEIELNWAPAPEPLCDKYFGCKSWTHSTCIADRCHCDSKYSWNASSLSCTKESSRNHSTYRMRLIIGIICIVIIILTCIGVLAYVTRNKIAHKFDKVSIRIQESLYDSEKHVKDLIGLGNLEENEGESIEVPYYTFRSIQAATNNFSDSNKLGQGGYGPVYKGIFPGGQDIAIKRLSSVSTQGLQEFKNEVVLIAKLQHRNLVRLRGYCVKRDEKILLYEYMSNKSLDLFIFDRTRTVLLDWKLRFDIILGIARGMLYLHQDSRLRVIHRDLKTGNILLDEEMNPKISDFGLAKIFGGKETEASTERIVGTYGYMAPEYALDGLFSVKSDVFSFGIILLEIISGKKNTGFYQSKETAASLLSYAWRLWTENKLLDLMDMALSESCDHNQFVKCARVGLLCVQDEPGDRPTMSNILTMLDNETSTIPIPTKPTFFMSKHHSCTSSSSKLEISMHFDTSYQVGR
ncbi:G-type lectin S-receptor-like serine/threonine-protein kinase At4g03230 isoform X2 [Vicia villosa]|uniref:G-type lectin S-receptor-like serine/threonine-protein kinase At4g03230 isoform X2 n=1 Tax=Vicia villosa TaxID=3911 RepID=UPI00273A7E51|nr:G-type lectin S-receptor-like serine/threonine-protein kinase At4g03230 isoform X2 [Vicia villosa]